MNPPKIYKISIDDIKFSDTEPPLDLNSYKISFASMSTYSVTSGSSNSITFETSMTNGKSMILFGGYHVPVIFDWGDFFANISVYFAYNGLYEQNNGKVIDGYLYINGQFERSYVNEFSPQDIRNIFSPFIYIDTRIEGLLDSIGSIVVSEVQNIGD